MMIFDIYNQKITKNHLVTLWYLKRQQVRRWLVSCLSRKAELF